MSSTTGRLLVFVAVAAAACGAPPAGSPPTGDPHGPSGGTSHGDGGAPASGDGVAVVSFVKVVSDRVEDVSSLDAWRRSFLRPGMSDEDQALAVWRSVVAFRSQDEPPREYLEQSGHVHDPIRDFNVYGYAQCCCASAFVEALARSAGLTARERSINNHNVPEVFFAGGWHLLDGAYINYFRRVDGAVASVDDLLAEVAAWYAANPSARGDAQALRQLRDSGAWLSGPELLARCPFYDQDGLLPAGVQGWDETMSDYDGSVSYPTEYGYSLGYQVNVELRKGERLVRNWSNVHRHVNQPDGLVCYSVDDVVGQGELRYSPAYGDLAPGRVGNGSLEYDVPLADPELLRAALLADNFAVGAPAHPQDGARPAVLVLRMPSSYVYLGGTMTFTATVASSGAIAVELSENNGLDWKPVVTVETSGPQTIDLAPFIYRRYDYRLRFTLTGASTGLEALRIVEDLQHSQRALPALGAGDNQIAVSAGPAEGTVTVQAALDSSLAGKALLYGDFHGAVDGLSGSPPGAATGGAGTLTFPVETPGDLRRLRFGATYRADNAEARWDYRVSVDGGATFTTVGSFAGPTGDGDVRYVTFTAVPPGTRRALAQYAATGSTRLFDFRIDADYVQPAGGFRPLRVTYEWTEAGAPRSDVHVATTANERYTIHCATAPVMKTLTVERAD